MVVTAVVLLSMLTLAGCSAGASLPTNDLGGVAESAPQFDGTAADSAVDENRQVIVTGYLTLTVEQPTAAAAEAARIVERVGGRVDSRRESAPTGDEPGSAELTVRIPTDKLEETLVSFKELGELENVEQSEQDVTSEARDLDVRITALRTSVDRLITLMASAGTTADLISIETALSERQANLESLESQQRYLDDQVEMSTFTLYLGSEEDAPVDEPDTFLSGLQAGWDMFVGFFSFLLVAIGVLMPWIILATVIAFGILYLLRRRKMKPVGSKPLGSKPLGSQPQGSQQVKPL